MDILKLAEDYSRAVVATVEAGEKFGKALVGLLKPIIPDLRFTLGWEEGGIEVLCLWSDSRDVLTSKVLEKRAPLYIQLDRVLEPYFRDVYIDCPFGVYVTEDEAKRIEAIIKGAKDADRRG